MFRMMRAQESSAMSDEEFDMFAAYRDKIKFQSQNYSQSELDIMEKKKVSKFVLMPDTLIRQIWDIIVN